MGYHHLTLEQRYQIQTLLALGISQTAISQQISVHKSTVGREIKRNIMISNYRAKGAHYLCRSRRREKGVGTRKIKDELKDIIEGKLKLGWSPEQISGRLNAEAGIKISHETIYQHILRDCGSRGPLRYYLRFAGYKQYRFKKSHWAERTRRGKRFIDQRPVEANKRSEFGHWERDLVEGSRSDRASLLTIVDRKSRYTLIKWVNFKTIDEVKQNTIAALKPYKRFNKTVTNDNGSEFQNPSALEKRLPVKVYYTEPHSPWQRGTNENTNGLIRQYFPKKTKLSQFPQWFPEAIQDTLNFRPRKILNYKTPYEVLFEKNLSLLRGALLRFGLEFSKST